jgi:hypothetical protein
MNQRTSVGKKLVEVSKEEEKRYEIRLTSSLDVARFLISQGQPFRGDDESSTSLNKGTFREMVDWYKDKVDIVKDAYDKGSKNCQMLSPDIQKDLQRKSQLSLWMRFEAENSRCLLMSLEMYQ